MKTKMLHRMTTSISCIKYAINFFTNGILICYGFSQIFELFLPFTGCITYLSVVIVLHSVHEI